MSKPSLETIHAGVAPNRLNIRSLAPRPDVHDHRFEQLFAKLGALGPVATFEVTPRLAFNYGHDKIASDAMIALGKTIISEYALVPRGPLLTRGAVSLEYPQIVQMAGDFYGKYDAGDKWSYEQVAADESKHGARLLSYESLALSDDSEKGINDALNLMNKLSNRRNDAEFGAKSEEALKQLEGAEVPWLGHMVNAFAASAGHGHTTLPDQTDGEEQSKKAKALFSSPEFTDATRRYMLLLLTNWDHFHPWCLYRYKHLHERAKSAAFDAGKACRDAKMQILRDPLSAGPGSAALKASLAMNAFADHFLTDAFSSGHLIGNRKSLRDKRVGSGTVLFTLPGGRVILRGELYGSKQARDLHDAYSHSGKAVTNAAGETYILQGDHFFGDYADDYGNEPLSAARVGEPGLTYAQTTSLLKAVALSIADVYQSFFRGALGEYSVSFNDATVKIAVPKVMVGLPKEEEHFLAWHKGLTLDPLVYVPHLRDKRCCSQENALAQRYFPKVSIDVSSGSGSLQ